MFLLKFTIFKYPFLFIHRNETCKDVPLFKRSIGKTVRSDLLKHGKGGNTYDGKYDLCRLTRLKKVKVTFAFQNL